MKKLFLTGCMLLSLAKFSPVFAQTDSLVVDSFPNYSFKTIIDSCFKHVDLTQVPTGILKEKAFPTIDIGAYDGTIQDSNEVNSSIFLRAFGTLTRAHIDTLIALDTVAITHLADTMNDYLLAGKVPIAILNYAYSCIKDSALADDLLSMDEFEISDVLGRPASPYENHTCFVAAAAISTFDSLQVTFIVPSHLYLSNDSREIDFVEIDFGNGEGYRTVTFDENIIITYDTVATIQMLIRVHFTNPQLARFQTRV